MFLTEHQLSIKKRNIYIAYEILQAKFIYDEGGVEQQWLLENQWVQKILPNFYEARESELTSKIGNVDFKNRKKMVLKPIIWFFDFLNYIFFKLQYCYMWPKITREKVGLNWAFFHPRDTQGVIWRRWKMLVAKLNYLEKIGQTQSQKEVVRVLATGVFDILHEEHIKFLQQARTAGDYLIVGVESDQRVRKMKGEGRPINSQAVRIKNLKKLGIAHQVIALPEKFNLPEEHLELVKKLKIKVLAVSAHTKHLAEKRHILQKVGGEVKIVLEHNPAVSTTLILEGFV